MSKPKKKRRQTGGIMGRSDIPYSAVNFVYSANLMHSNIYLEVIGNIYDNPELLEVSA